jgi:hypothetical protein
MTHEEGRCRAFDVFAAGVDKTFPTAKFFVVAIRIQASVELAASGLLDIDPDRAASMRAHGSTIRCLAIQRRRGEDEENPRERLGYRSLNSNGTPGPCQMHAGSVVVPPEVEVVVPPELEVVVSPELEVVVVPPELEVVVPPVLVEVVDVLATTSTTFV